jgi:hypothetical protein
MKSDHIDNRKLREIVEEETLLNPAEVKHLGECDECMEMIRTIVRQKLSKSAGQDC